MYLAVGNSKKHWHTYRASLSTAEGGIWATNHEGKTRDLQLGLRFSETTAINHSSVISQSFEDPNLNGFFCGAFRLCISSTGADPKYIETTRSFSEET